MEHLEMDVCLQVTTERTAWELAEELFVDMVTIHPSVIFGPVLNRRGGSSVEIVRVRSLDTLRHILVVFHTFHGSCSMDCTCAVSNRHVLHR